MNEQTTASPTAASKSGMGALLVVIVLVVIIAGVGVAFWLINNNSVDSNRQTTPTPTPTAEVTNSPTTSPTQTTAPTTSFTKSQLAEFNGQNGKDCYVAVDGSVYKIAGFGLWQNGRHIAPGADEVRCGADMTEKMNESPHGRAKLSLLEKVGIIAQ